MSGVHVTAPQEAGPYHVADQADRADRAVVPLIAFVLLSVLACADAVLVRKTEFSRSLPLARRPEGPELAPETPRSAVSPASPLEAIDRPPQVTVRISRAGGGQKIRFAVNGPYRMTRGLELSSDAEDHLLAAGEGLPEGRAVARAGQVSINGVALLSEEVAVHPRGDGTVQIDGTGYRGSLLFQADQQDRLTVSNQVGLEQYVCGVLLSEMPARFGREALRSQAVIARSFALYQLLRGRLLRDDQGSQVYTGMHNESETVRRLVRSTVGEVLTYQGRLLETYFHSTCGGVTSSARGVFNIPAERPLQGGVVCRDCRHSPHFRWTREIPTRRLSELYSGAFGDHLRLVVHKRLPSGRTRTVALLDGTGQERDRLLADRFRNRFNSGRPLRQQLPSMLIRGIESRGDSLRVQGNGFGHGVGLCQYGAGGLAARGTGYRKILERYYPGAVVRRLYE